MLLFYVHDSRSVYLKNYVFEKLQQDMRVIKIQHLYHELSNLFACLLAPGLNTEVLLFRLEINVRGGGWCWVNFQCRGVLLVWIRVRQGPNALAVGAGGGCLDSFSLTYQFSFFFSLSLRDDPI